jgi:hypothetical protein
MGVPSARTRTASRTFLCFRPSWSCSGYVKSQARRSMSYAPFLFFLLQILGMFGLMLAAARSWR